MVVKRLLVFALIVASTVKGADAPFGDIPASLSLSASQSVRRNAANNGFEAFTPGGGGGTPGGSDTDIQFNNSGSFGGSDDFKWIDADTALLIGGSSFSIADQGNIRVSKAFKIEARNNADNGNILVLEKKVTSGHDNLVVGDTSGGRIEFTGAGNNMSILPASDGSLNITAVGGSIDITADLADAFSTNINGDLEIQNGGWLLLQPQTTPAPPNRSFGPFEGVMYEDSTDHHFYGYNGTAWRQLDNNPTPTPTATATPSATATATATPSATATATPTATAAAPADAHYVTTQSESGLSNEFNLGALSNGFLKQTVTTGVSTITIDSSTYLTGNQTITLTGDVTGSGATAITTTLANIPSSVPAAGSIIFADIAAPSSPSAAHLAIFGDSTDLRFHDKNAAGTIGTTVVADTGATNNFLTAVSASGVISKAQPSYSNLSGTDAPAIGNVTGLGTGVGTALAVNVGTAGAFVTNGGALGTPSSGTVSSCTAATDSTAGVMSAADHTTLTNISTATATGVAPPFVCVGCPAVAFKTGVDFKTNAVTDIFTVPTSRAFLVNWAEIIPTTVSGGLAVAIVWKIQDSVGSFALTTVTAASSAAPITTKAWFQTGTIAAGNGGGTGAIAAAADKIQFNISTAWTTSTTVTGTVIVHGYYTQ